MDADLSEIKRALRLMTTPGQTYELRAIGTHCHTVSGYFTDMNLMAKAAEYWSGKGPAVYFTPNPTRPELMSRSPEMVTEFAKVTTGDKEIGRRAWFLVDFDAVRPAGIPASKEEHRQALLQARACWEWLIREGFPQPLLADSGNGGHVCIRVDLPNEDEVRGVLAGALKGLAAKFNTPQVSVDPATHNAARVWKLYGTLSRKGHEYQDRVHRLARILEEPGEGVAGLDQLQKLVIQEEPAKQPVRAKPLASSLAPSRGDYSTLDVVGWFQSHGAYGRPLSGGKHAVDCPWANEHTERNSAEHSDTVVYEAEGGGWPQFNCLHAHCVDRSISDVLSLWPDADRFCSSTWQTEPLTSRFPTGKKKGLSEINAQAKELDEAAQSLLETRQPNILSLSPLRIVETGPPTYYPTVNGYELKLADVEFLEWHRFKRCCINALQFVPILPRLPRAGGKGFLSPLEVWDQLLAEACETATREAGPDDASEEGACWVSIRSYLAEKLVIPDEKKTPGMAVAAGQLVLHEEAFHFRGEALRKWLASHQLNNLKANQLWKVVRDHGGYPSVLKVDKKKSVRCWVIPVGATEEVETVTPVTSSERANVTDFEHENGG